MGRRSVEHCVQLVCQVVKHAADVIQDGDCCLLAGKRAGSWILKKKRSLADSEVETAQLQRHMTDFCIVKDDLKPQ